MITSVQSPQPTQDNDPEVEVIKDLEQRGFQGIDTLSLEELQLLAERKRKQLQLEAAQKKAQLESDISSIDQQMQELSAKRAALADELTAHLKSMGLPTGGGERSARKGPRKNQKAVEAQPSQTSETVLSE